MTKIIEVYECADGTFKRFEETTPEDALKNEHLRRRYIEEDINKAVEEEILKWFGVDHTNYANNGDIEQSNLWRFTRGIWKDLGDDNLGKFYINRIS